jgi:hypothetical protein
VPQGRGMGGHVQLESYGARRVQLLLTAFSGLLLTAALRPAHAQTTRDSAFVIATLGADLRVRFSGVPLVVTLAVDNSREAGIATAQDYSFADVSSDAAWPMRLLASTANAALSQHGAVNGETVNRPGGPKSPVTRILTLGRINFTETTSAIRLRIQTPPFGTSEETVWQYTISRNASGPSSVVARKLLFSAEIQFPEK